MNSRLTILIPVKNDAANLALCLESVKEFDDVVVVDSGSNDATCEIASQFGRKVIDFKWDGFCPKKRNWVLRTLVFKYPWVLFLDADERMTQKFQAEIQATLANTSHNAFWIRYENWFMGRLLRYGDSMRKTALLRVGHGEYEEVRENRWSSCDMEVHEQLVVEGTIGTLASKLEHHDLRSLHRYYERHNEYSTWEAKRFLTLKDRGQLTSRQRLKYRMLMWPLFPLLYFMASYIFKAGFLDGKPGLFFALGKTRYYFQIQSKIREFRHA